MHLTSQEDYSKGFDGSGMAPEMIFIRTKDSGLKEFIIPKETDINGEKTPDLIPQDEE